MKQLNVGLLLLCITFSKVYAQQDPLYNLYQFNQVMINPAYTGLYEDMTLNLIARKQWVGIEGSPQTNFLSLTSSMSDRFGVGGMIITDQLGVNFNSEIQAAFSFKVINNKGRVLSLGVQGGAVNYRYDYSKLNLEYLDDEDLDMNRTQFTKPILEPVSFTKQIAGIWAFHPPVCWT